MTLYLTPALEQRLENLAARTNRSPDELAQELIDRCLRDIETRTAEVREAEDEADREGWLTSDGVMAQLEQRFPKSA